MNHFSFRLDSEKRLAQLVPPLLSIGYSTQDPPAFRALKRDKIDVPVVKSVGIEARYRQYRSHSVRKLQAGVL